jgi:hypothetical protein
MMNRLGEASSMAGIGLILNALGALATSGGKDPMAWGQVIAGIFAILKKEGGNAAG